MRRIRFKARALKTGKMVEGYYAHQHIANFDADGQHINSYDEQDAIYNDEPGNRKLFDDYRMYLEKTTIEERIKRAEEANAQVEERAKASADYAEEKLGWHEARKKRAEERLNEVDIELQNIYNVIEE